MSKEGGNAEAPPQDSSSPQKKDADIYENRGSKKIIRLVTVMAYMFSVSFVAIVLSAYYLFLWEPPNPRLIHRAQRLRAEPQIQFLLSDAPHPVVGPHHLHQIFQDVEEKNHSTKGLTARTGEFFGVMFSEDEDEKTQDPLDHSLSRLRESLMENLREKMNQSTHDDSFNKNVTELERTAKDRSGSNFGNGSMVSLKEESSQTNAPGDNAVIPDSSISGEDKERSARTKSSNIPESLSRDNSSGNSSLNDSGNGQHPIVHPIDPLDPRYFGSLEDAGTKPNDSIVTNIYKNQTVGKTVSSTQPLVINSNSTMPTIIKSFNNGPSSNGTLNNKEVKTEAISKKKQTMKQTQMDKPNLRKSGRRNFNSTYIRNSPERESTVREEFPGRMMPTSVKPTNLAINSQDIQIEKLTTKPTIERSKDLSRAEASTKKPKNLLTILTKISTAADVENVSSTTSFAITSENYQTDSTPITRSSDSSV